MKRFLSENPFSSVLIAGTPVFLSLLMLFAAVLTAHAQEAAFGSVAKPSKYVSTVLTPAGIRILKIDYPCDQHPTASVEIRILDRETIENPMLTTPIFFEKTWLSQTDILDHRVKDVLADCYFGDHDDNILRTLQFRNPEATMNILGWVGAFGVRDTVVRVKMKNIKTQNEETTLIFPNASRTQVGMMPSATDPFSSKAFGFDLIGPEFDHPCEILVWVLRGDQILIREILHWDGHMEHPYVEEAIEVAHGPRTTKKKDDFFDEEDDDSEDEEDAGDEEDSDEDSDDGDDDSGDDDDSGEEEEDFFDEE